MSRNRIATAVSVSHIHSVESRESLPLTAPSLENAFGAFCIGWWRFQRIFWQPCGNLLTTLTGEHRLRMGSCLARLACLKLCYANVTFGHSWTPFGSSFSAVMGGSRFSATVAQVFQSRDITDLRSQKLGAFHVMLSDESTCSTTSEHAFRYLTCRSLGHAAIES